VVLCARHDGFDGFAEAVDLFSGSVDVGADTGAAEEGRDDGSDKNVVLGEEVVAEFTRLDGVEVDGAESAGLVRLQVDEHFGAVNFGEALGPAILEVAEAGEFAVGPDRLMEFESLQSGIVHGGGVRADLFVLADVFVHRRRRGHQRPVFFDAVFSHVQHASADGGGEPLVEAGSVEVGIYIRELEWDVGKRVRAIDDAGDAAAARQCTDFLDGEHLAGHEANLRDVDDAGARRDGLLVQDDQIGWIFYGNSEVHLLEYDFFAALALLPGGDHAGIVLRGGEDLVAGSEVDAKLGDLQRFAGVARDGDAFRISAPHASEARADVFNLGLQVMPHAVAGELVAVTYGFDLRIQDGGRRGGHAAIIEIEDGGIVAVGAANGLPVGFVDGDFRGGEMRVGAVQEAGEHNRLRSKQKMAAVQF